jgi:hypothetical protein
MRNRLQVLAIVAVAAALGISVGASAQQSASLSDGVKEFQKQLDTYLKLRDDLSRKLKPISTTPDAAELSARQDALAAALKAARTGAKQGNVVNPAMAAHITRIVTADFRRRNAAAESATLKEVPRSPRPAINQAYPADAALPTVPPLLLAALPRLPDNLQYRFFGRHVAILDGDVQIIIDYVADALPPH